MMAENSRNHPTQRNEAMLTTRTTKAGQITRDVEIGDNHGGICRVHVTETKGKVVSDTSYWLSRIPSQIGGRAFQVEKDGGEIYNVLLSGYKGDSCDCPAGCYQRSPVPCRHIHLCHQATLENKI
jgi:hypothetical protein